MKCNMHYCKNWEDAPYNNCKLKREPKMEVVFLMVLTDIPLVTCGDYET